MTRTTASATVPRTTAATDAASETCSKRRALASRMSARAYAVVRLATRAADAVGAVIMRMLRPQLPPCSWLGLHALAAAWPLA